MMRTYLRIILTLKWLKFTRETYDTNDGFPWKPPHAQTAQHKPLQEFEWHVYVITSHFTVSLFFDRLHNYTSSTDNTQTFNKASMNLHGPNPSHHTYLAFIFWDFTCLLLTVWTGRSLKRFNLVRENGMLDLSLLTTTSSLPPISTMLKESRNYALVQNLALSSPSGWTPCECDVNLSTAPVSLYGDRKWCWKTLLCRCVFVSWVELEWKRVWRLPDPQHIIHTCPLPHHSEMTVTHPAFMAGGHQLLLRFKQECLTL